MPTGRLAAYRARVRDALHVALAEEHPPHLIALSFAIGIFLTALPTFGTALVALAWLGYRYEWANTLAFLAAAAIMNPLAKSSVYVASVFVGTLLLGPVPGPAHVDAILTIGLDVLVRLVVGNVLLAALFAVVGYGIAVRLVPVVRRGGP